MADDVVEEGLARAVVSGEDHVLVTAFTFNLHKRNGDRTSGAGCNNPNKLATQSLTPTGYQV